VSTWRLGLRLALQANRVRLVATSVAVSFTVAFLLGALGALPARQAKLERLDARNVAQVGSVAATGASQPVAVVRLESQSGVYRGRPLTVRLMTAEPGGPLPPGLARNPRAGEVIASPDLADLLRGSHAEELATRVPGHLVSTIGEPGLAGPHELYAYVGVASFDHEPPQVQSYGSHYKRTPAPRELQIAAWLGALGLLLPVLVLVATATRLSASSRDRRLAALRLVGATPKQARVIAGAEGLVAGVLGTAGGLVIFWLLRRPACALLPFPEGLYAQDLMPPLTPLVAVIVGVPLLAVTASIFALRRVMTSPLGVRRMARVKRLGWWRLAPLVTGLAMLVLLRANHDEWPPGTPPGTTLLLGGGALTLVGVAVAAPVVTRLGGQLLIRIPGVSASLAARRIEADPTASARVVTGMALVLFVAAWLLAFLPVLERSSNGDEQLLSSVPAGTIMTLSGINQAKVGKVAGVPGVRAVAALGYSRLTPPGWVNDDGSDPAHSSRTVDVGSCEALATVTGKALPCGQAKVFWLAREPLVFPSVPIASALVAGERVGVLDGDGALQAHLTLPSLIPELPIPAYGGLLQGEMLVDPSLLPPVPSRLVATTDGRADTVERVRSVLPLEASMQAQTVEERIQAAGSVYLGYLRAVRIGIVLALLVGAASLAVTTADTVAERRRSLASLVALGTPLRVLRRTVLLQTAAPMLTNVVTTLAAGAVASACYLGVTDGSYQGPWSLPWGSWGLTTLAAVLAVLLATAATLPLVSAVGRPEALRAE
jgi:hypothetical protein